MKVAFLFPGQGSQSVGMMDAWAEHAGVQAVLQQGNHALGEDLTGLIAHGPADALNLTTNTQPAMLLCSVAMYRAWQQAGGLTPALVAGHSLGEYSALVAADTLDLADAVRTVRVRAQAMQSAVPVGQGGMAAILGLDDEAVRQVCAQASGDQMIVEAVNYNAPAQVVIAGHVAAVEKACELAKAAGAKRALSLPVSAPFHSRLLQPAAQVLQDTLAAIEIHTPNIPLINNVDVAMPADPVAIRDALVRQAWHPVRWVETIQSMKQQGITHLVECGPGKVLSGLVKRIDRDLVAYNITDPASLQQTLDALGA
ncbi:ACP S-malonyltransferase [Castellaniella sp.]|uniref:ACP S-malonyltransferase n=1 Tax=Castellaniella sp. TaxID=1955812 RepID=UPI002AFEB4CD|nr:ACP S-malonyltransferase [Castellaniella sp.]